jgi:hypothetical protein
MARLSLARVRLRCVRAGLTFRPSPPACGVRDTCCACSFCRVVFSTEAGPCGSPVGSGGVTGKAGTGRIGPALHAWRSGSRSSLPGACPAGGSGPPPLCSPPGALRAARPARRPCTSNASPDSPLTRSWTSSRVTRPLGDRAGRSQHPHRHRPGDLHLDIESELVFGLR